MWLLVLVRTHTEVLDGFPGVPLATEQDGVGSSGCPKSELIESQGLATSLENTLLGRLSEAKGCDGQLGDLKQADVIGDSSNDDDGFRLTIRST